jgi:hypothetical protein
MDNKKSECMRGFMLYRYFKTHLCYKSSRMAMKAHLYRNNTNRNKVSLQVI